MRGLQLGIVLVLLGSLRGGSDEIRFSRDILPVLSDKCFQCHGPDEGTRKAGLRLDVEEEGKKVLVRGEPGESLLYQRISSADPEEKMPPAKAGKVLETREIELIRRWIEQGGDWELHWAYVRPVKARVPVGRGGHPVDAFVRERLAKEGLEPAPEASKKTLIRRLSFDLRGLPPTIEEVDEFLADRAEDAYERLVDRFLASPHYGERMAMSWMDAARYADTDGFQQDETRTNWPWRDWVVKAFNANMPFDQFTKEQFAGDLLPDATVEQKLATTFHRNHMTNGEGGRDPEESRIDYVLDRVNSTGTVWLGMTLGCAQCHSHKYDPISQTEYYQLAAFFNSVAEDGKAGGGAKPFLKYTSRYAGQAVNSAERLLQKREEELKEARAEALRGFEHWLERQREALDGDYRAWKSLQAMSLSSTDGTLLQQEPDGTIMSGGENPKQEEYRVLGRAGPGMVTGLMLEVFPHETFTGGGLGRSSDGHFILTTLKVSIRNRQSSIDQPITIRSAVASFAADKKKEGGGFGPVQEVLDDDPRTGWTTRGSDAKEKQVAVFGFSEAVMLGGEDYLYIELGQRSLLGYQNIGRFRLSVTEQVGPALEKIGKAPLEELAQLGGEEEIPEALRGALMETFLAGEEVYLRVLAGRKRAAQALEEAKRAAGELKVMVLEDLPSPRATHVLIRGEWDKKGEEVEPGVPSALGRMTKERLRNRLGLAEWMVSGENPLTGRVIVNQLWQVVFGHGLVRTPEDFGVQGERPTHPELLDWLAVEFVESGWDVKRMLKLLVTSQTYRQQSEAAAELWAKDPENRLLARASRWRLPAWMIRDAALRASGLMNPAVGGPPIKPYHPDGVWDEIFMGRFRYQASEGEEQYRRTLYAFWRRTAAPAFLFDCAERRVSEVQVRRTNTPLQALGLMNDVTYVEAARALAAAVLAQGEREPLRELMRRVLSRKPSQEEERTLERQLEQARAFYEGNPGAAERLLRHGQWQGRDGLNVRELTALTTVAMLVLNLDEAITRE